MTSGFQCGVLRFLSIGALLATAACSGDLNPVRDVAVAVGAGAEAEPAPDFVTASRPDSVDYTRPGVAPQTFKPKSAAEVQAAEAAMERIRARNEAEAAAARQLGAAPPPIVPATGRRP